MESQCIRIYNNKDDLILDSSGSRYSISKATRLCSILEPHDLIGSLPNPSNVQALLGIVETSACAYLVTVQQGIEVCNILGSSIFKVSSLEFFSLGEQSGLNPEIAMLNDFIKKNSLYYSRHYDLTQTLQSNLEKPSANDFNLLHSDFCWNYQMALNIDCKVVKPLMVGVINGFVGCRAVNCYSKKCSYNLICRKDSRRSGLRFLVRGINKNGNVANFVENEQLLFCNEDESTHLISYLQVRGSIPCYWNQIPDYGRNPKINLQNDYSENLNAFNKHTMECNEKYGKTVFVNLIDMKGDQKRIGDLFQNLVADAKKTNATLQCDYVWFDFHSECKKMRYHNISKLMKKNTVSQALSSIGFTHFRVPKDWAISSRTSIPEVLKTQEGVFRTNCIDNLDRTNVVQSVFGRQALHQILESLKLSNGQSEDIFKPFHQDFEPNFKGVWADNGDALSNAYSGTNAQKRDFTRTGKRTLKGNLDDGVVTLKRYYFNCFKDGYNQDCHDYFLGKINPKKDKFKKHSCLVLDVAIIAIFLLTYIAYSITISSVMKPNQESSLRTKLFKALTFCGLMYFTMKTVFGKLKSKIFDFGTIHYH